MNHLYLPEDTAYGRQLWIKLGASLGIFCISLLAVSFPSLSRRFKSIRIPSLLFFLGKHFGTGVILSTAFVHLLTDAFKALKSEWTGLIVLVSLLAIFLVEYISTAYVDYLHSYSSTPPTPTSSAAPSLSRADSFSSSNRPRLSPDQRLQFGNGKKRSPSREIPEVLEGSEATSLLDAPALGTVTYGTHNVVRAEDEGEAVVAFPRHSCQGADSGTQPIPLHTTSEQEGAGGDVEIVPVAEAGRDDSIFGGGHHRHESRQAHASHSTRSKKIAAVVLLNAAEDPEGEAPEQVRRGDSHHLYHHHHHRHHGPHAHGHGHGHTDIESWGAEVDEEERLLAHDHHGSGHEHDQHVDHGEEVMIGRRRQIVGILMLQIGIMLHSLVIGLTLAITTGPEFTTLVTAILFHQLFEGLSLGIRIAALPTDSAALLSSSKHVHLLKPTLATTFALTTPLGIGIGLLVFSAEARHAGGSGALVRFQGVMSAMSAGMLIYAACVEMLAGDFVMDPLMWRSGFKRQCMALASLVAGVCAMAVVGFD